MSRKFLFAVAALSVVFVGCGSKNGGGDFPSDFYEKNDAAKMTYMIKNVEPDSVARFLCNAALGRIKGVSIDTLATANLYCLEHYRGENLDIYSREFDDYKATLPLAYKMKIEKMNGTYDDDALGYQLGLEYVGYIREHKLQTKEIDKELSQLRKQVDNETFEKFMTGFRVALENDRGKDLPENVYMRYSR